ncbi:LysR family transcriptional regulator [Nonomuraea typhae]|uniref:LysR family transcriptional regulator n=1 Tax=Nonomuraea typhae TaxID=2603600 RepID=A0ABW7YJ68_9ACTN
MLETNDLRLLDEVARSGSFTAAAELLGYTQSAVSRRIAALERAAGGPLFERLARGVRLTPAGHALHRHALAILERLDQAGEELAAIHTGGGGRLRIGAFATANITMVPAALKRFTDAYPGVTVRLTEGFSPQLVERLEAGELDVAVISDYPAGLPGGRPAVPQGSRRTSVMPGADPRPASPEGDRAAWPEGDRQAWQEGDRQAWQEGAGQVGGSECAGQGGGPGDGRRQVAAGHDRSRGPQGGERRLVLLGEDRLLVALPSAHPLAGKAAVELADLREETWIEAAPRGQPTLLLAAAAAAGFVPRDGLRVAEWSGKFGFVAAGLGVTLVPELAARAVPRGVVLRPLTSTGPTRRYYAALPDVPLPAALAFVEHLRPQAPVP